MSVLIVTYNHECFIAQALDGVLMQETTFRYEVVIGEDGSVDRTREIVLSYQERFPDRIRLMLQPYNTGGRQNLVSILGVCRGEYVAILEGDDYWTDKLQLQLQVELLQANPKAFICGARAQIWKQGENAPSEITPSENSVILSKFGARELFEGLWWFRTCTKMFPRHVLLAAPIHFLEADWAGTMWCIAHTNFGQVCFLDRVVGVYREHAGGSWSSQPYYQKVSKDVRTLFDLIPVFTGSDRAFLKTLMLHRMSELICLKETTPGIILKCAHLVAIRNPPAWRLVAESVGVGLRRMLGIGAT
ncbi:MAG: glycosyltransferase [Gemmatimonadaceae bacterium]|nr:glycosyltransferase [Gemmatimonadaceae bacterium]